MCSGNVDILSYYKHKLHIFWNFQRNIKTSSRVGHNRDALPVRPGGFLHNGNAKKDYAYERVSLTSTLTNLAAQPELHTVPLAPAKFAQRTGRIAQSGSRGQHALGGALQLRGGAAAHAQAAAAGQVRREASDSRARLQKDFDRKTLEGKGDAMQFVGGAGVYLVLDVIGGAMINTAETCALCVCVLFNIMPSSVKA